MLHEQLPDRRFGIEDVTLAYCDKRYLPRIAERLQGSGRDVQQIANLAARQVVLRPDRRMIVLIGQLQGFFGPVDHSEQLPDFLALHR